MSAEIRVGSRACPSRITLSDGDSRAILDGVIPFNNISGRSGGEIVSSVLLYQSIYGSRTAVHITVEVIYT